MEIFPVSPLPANMTRTFKFNVSVQRFDSGARQAVTAWSKPLYEWRIPWRNMNETKQNTLASFAKDMFGPLTPFLMKDPYDYRVNSVVAVSTSQTQGGTLQIYDVKSFFIRVDTTTVSTMTSNLSGYVSLGTEYDYDQDTGALTVNTIAATDFWTVASAQYFRKVAFKEDYSDQSPIWNIFNSNITIEEIV
jgi:hypothetical protein